MPIVREQRTYKVRTAFFRRVWLFWLKVANSILIFFSLRAKKKFWGVVYDAVTKQPLDPAIVKIAYLGDTKTSTVVTDLSGKYGFLAHPGKFKLLAKKTNYIFPSQIITGSKDGIYDNLYHGEFFELVDGYEVVGPNIPMDPVNFDCNQKAKLAVTRHHPYIKYLFKTIVGLVFWTGFILLAAYVGIHRLQSPLPILAGAGIYAALIVLSFITPELRLWGFVKQKVFEDKILLLELQNALLPGVVMGKAEVEPTGKFLLRANKGTYLLSVSIRDANGGVVLIGRTKVRVGSEGICNQTIKIH